MRLVQPPQMGTAPSHRRLRFQHEFSQFSTHPKTLRVSDLLGLQRSSWWISLPLRYGIPICATSAGMHWLISQSLFLARVTAFFADRGGEDVEGSFSTCGYSPMAVFISKLSRLEDSCVCDMGDERGGVRRCQF